MLIVLRFVSDQTFEHILLSKSSRYKAFYRHSNTHEGHILIKQCENVTPH